MRTLYGFLQSPWTERALWALDHHSLAYRYHEHIPLLGEVLLRKKAGTLTKKNVTVPLLIDGKQILRSSVEIARYADRMGSGTPLFVRNDNGSIDRYITLADRMLCAGRAWVLSHLLKNRAAQREALPSLLPGPIRTLLAPTAMAVAFFLRVKHAVPPDVQGQIDRELIPALEDVRKALTGKVYLLGSFSFADIAIASALASVRPTDRAPIGPATRAIWTNERVAESFEDLLMWRDAIYAKHR
ncbi:MAG: glutathione S-transferase N-terminal domain-containing protein [Polyangiaceae bacterium]|nr:glutathione S-transferase N-terminal domain-containing protein [Polyangiaceae bacterium]